MYIPCIYRKMLIYMEYTWYIHGIYVIKPCMYFVYIMHVQRLPGGWCCAGGQVPIPPDPPAMTSPGRVMTLILLHSVEHFVFLLLAIWIRIARLELKIAGKCRAWHARHTNRSSSTSVIPSPVYTAVPMISHSRPAASGRWTQEYTDIPGIYIVPGIYLEYANAGPVDAAGKTVQARPRTLFIVYLPYIPAYALHVGRSPWISMHLPHLLARCCTILTF